VFFIKCIIRKRNYAHAVNQACIPDSLVENIEVFEQHHVASSTADDTPIASIHNLVGTAMVSTNNGSLHLRHICKFLPNTCYDRQKFAAITIRLHEPCCTVLLFSSGKMVLTGCKTFTNCVLSSHKVCNFLKKCMPSCKVRLLSVKIQNIVGNVDLNLDKTRFLNLNRLYESHSVFCTYQKNMFPGLIYRPNKSPVVLLLFQSGKIVITGGKSTHDVMYGWKLLWPVVRQCICAKDTPN
jgi:transcription initiation factor TFIID TATA-box-binding protein